MLSWLSNQKSCTDKQNIKRKYTDEEKELIRNRDFFFSPIRAI